MHINLIIQLIILLILILFSAYFSGSETAYFALNHLERDKLLKKTKPGLKVFIRRILNTPSRILITILTGNMIVNFLFASLLDMVVEEFFGGYVWLISIFIGTVLILIFGEMAPKNLAIRHPVAFLYATSGLLKGIYFILQPVQKILLVFEQAMIGLFKKERDNSLEENRIYMTSTLQMGLKKGILHLSEHSILESYFDFKQKTAEEVMVPRSEIHGIEHRVRLNQITRDDFEKSTTRLLPVFKKNLDQISGYIDEERLTVLRLDPAFLKKKASDISLTVNAFPLKKPLLEIMQELLNTGSKMALVIDEYGGTAGIITLQQLLENFLHYFFPAKKENIKIIAKNRYLASGQISLDDLNRILKAKFKSENKTLAGLLFEAFGEIPAAGQRIKIDGYEFIILSLDRHRIERVEVRKR